MKKILIIITGILFTLISYSQNKKLIAAWIWIDSAHSHSISIFLRNENDITQMLDIIKSPIATKDNTKNGKYLIKDGNTLEITWEDGSTEIRKFKFLNKYYDGLQMTILKNKDEDIGGVYIFNKVVDKEVPLAH